MKIKEPITSPSVILKDFLSENSNYRINDTSKSNGNIDDISDEDEVWLVQCPKSFDIQQLQEQKLKLPGKSNCNLIETFAEEFLTPKDLYLGFKTNKEYKLKKLEIKGNILIREKLKLIKTEKINIGEDNLNTMRVPFPSNLKTRHPLHGIKYEERITLNDDIRKRLKKSDEIIKKSKKLNKYEYMADQSISKTSRKRKLSTNVKPVKMKTFDELKLETDDDISMDLAWIKNI